MTRPILGLAVLLISTAAVADGAPDHDRAVALFDEARKMIDDGNCDGAMPKLEQSLRYEPSVGARLSMADCTEPHNPLEAWSQLREAQRLAYLKHDERTKVAQDRAAALEAKLPIVHVVVPPQGLVEPGFELRVDGVLIDRFFYLDGVLAMSAGPHEIEATTPSRRWSQQVVAQAGVMTSVSVRLEASSSKPATVAPPPVAPPHESGSAQRTVGLFLSGAGVASIVAGGVFGGAALMKKADIDAACGGNAGACSAPVGSLDAQAAEQQTFARLSTLGFIVGGVALASGVVLYLTAPHARMPVAVTGSIDPHATALQVLGMF